MTNDGAPGWDAIQAVFEALYPGTTPLHSGVNRDRSGDATFAVRAWRGEGVWHLTTLGLSELWEKESEHAQTSGWGMEITMLLPREAGRESLPSWPIGLLRGLAEMIEALRTPPQPGNRVNLGRPLGPHGAEPAKQEGGDESAARQLTALVWVRDDRLGEHGVIDTPNGSLGFMRVVGISSEELELPAELLLPALEQLEPSNITDPARLSR